MRRLPPQRHPPKAHPGGRLNCSITIVRMNKVFLLDGEQRLTRLDEAPFDSEAVLQELLARFPDVLDATGGEQLRLLLVTREAPVPDEPGGSGRWSVDHLFVDQKAVPTIVEVKRSTDTRIRREVVGQMLEYAANATAFWQPAELRRRFEKRCQEEGADANQTLLAFLECQDGPESAEGRIELFWSEFSEHLQAARLRLIFVADAMPHELRRLVDFLNDRLGGIEVLGVEVRQFTGDGVKTVVSNVVGGKSAGAAGPLMQKKWDRESVLEDLVRQVGGDAEVAVRRIMAWAKPLYPSNNYGKGKTMGSWWPSARTNGVDYFPFVIYTNGSVEIPFQHLMRRPPFDALEIRGDFRRRLNLIPGAELPESSLEGRPSFPVTLTCLEEGWLRFKEAVSWFSSQIPA